MHINVSILNTKQYMAAVSVILVAIATYYILKIKSTLEGEEGI